MATPHICNIQDTNDYATRNCVTFVIHGSGKTAQHTWIFPFEKFFRQKYGKMMVSDRFDRARKWKNSQNHIHIIVRKLWVNTKIGTRTQVFRAPFLYPLWQQDFWQCSDSSKSSKNMAWQIFKPKSTAWESFVLTLLPRPFIITYSLTKNSGNKWKRSLWPKDFSYIYEIMRRELMRTTGTVNWLARLVLKR